MRRLLPALVTVSSALLYGQVDPPTRCARLNYTQGSVSFDPAGLDQWGPATINRPMTTGDQLWTDNGSRAEFHIGQAGMRLGPNTAFQFLNLDDHTAQVQITQGQLYVHMRFIHPNDNFEVDTPGLAFTITRPGTYRIDANPDNATTMVKVFAGEGMVTGGGQTFPVAGTQWVTAYGTGQVSFDLENGAHPDDFDNWCWGRIEREEHSASLRYVNSEMIGFQDLDDNGSWRVDATYGNVWVPRSVPEGWAPYHYGHWAWVDPWGWTWVDDASWGFAPFHYGRWAYVGGGWAWVPGPMAARPVYAPALVAWVGGSGWGASISFGGGGGGGVFAWVPLGPREVWVPSYHVSQAYFAQVNTSNTVVANVNITQVYNTTVINHTTNVTVVNYVNARAPNAVVAVPANAMASARPVNEIAKPVPPQELARAQVVRTAAVVPQPAAVLGHPTGASAARPPARALSTPVVAKTAPPPPPVAFSARQTALQQHPGQPIEASTMQRLRATAPPAAAPRPAVQVVHVTQQGPPPAPGHRTAPAPQTAQGAQGRPAYTPPQQGHPASAPPSQQQAERPAYGAPQQPRPPQESARPSYGAPPQSHPANAAPQEQQARPAYGRPPETQPHPVNAAPQEQQARPAYGRPPEAQPRNAPAENQSAPHPPQNQREVAHPAQNQPERPAAQHPQNNPAQKKPEQKKPEEKKPEEKQP